MMMEIKFRAWVKRKNELMYLRGFRYSGNEKIKITFADEDKDDCTYTFLNKDVILEQFTGLRDKNGMEIYDGDILKAEIHKKVKSTEDEDFYGGDGYKIELSNEEWTVEYKERFNQGNGFYCYGKDRRFSTRLTGSKILNCKLEVIGNVHEVEEDEI